MENSPTALRIGVLTVVEFICWVRDPPKKHTCHVIIKFHIKLTLLRVDAFNRCSVAAIRGGCNVSVSCISAPSLW